MTWFFFVPEDSRRLCAGVQSNPLAGQFPGGHPGIFLREGGKQPGLGLHQRYLQPPKGQLLRKFQPDKAAADDHHMLRLPGQLLQPDTVLHRTQGADAGTIRPRDGQHDRGSPGGQHQPVIPLPGFPSAVQGQHLHRLPLPVNSQHPVPGVGGDAPLFPQFLHGEGDQFLRLGDAAPYKIGQPARAVADIACGFKDVDLHLPVQTPGLCRGAESRSGAADDHHLHTVCLLIPSRPSPCQAGGFLL